MVCNVSVPTEKLYNFSDKNTEISCTHTVNVRRDLQSFSLLYYGMLSVATETLEEIENSFLMR